MIAPPLITLTAPELGGGIGTNIVNLANEFRKMGFRVDVVLDTLTGSLVHQLDDSVGVVKLKTSHTVGGIPSLVWYLLRNRPDVMLTPVVRHTVLALRAKSVTRSRTRVFAQVHSTYSKAFQILKPSKLKIRLRKIKKYYPRCELIITVSKGVTEDFSSLTGIPAAMMDHVYNPVFTKSLVTRADEKIPHGWFQPGQPPVILGVGRLVPAKNFPLLIRAFEIVRQNTFCRCVIIGEGAERRAIESAIEKSGFPKDIELLGHMENPLPYMRRAGVFVLSSSWEGFGSVLVEAMASGCPVVSTDCPYGPREILEDGFYGHIVPVDDAIPMAQAISETLCNPRDPQKMIKGAHRFDVTTIAETYLDKFGLERTI